MHSKPQQPYRVRARKTTGLDDHPKEKRVAHTAGLTSYDDSRSSRKKKKSLNIKQGLILSEGDFNLEGGFLGTPRGSPSQGWGNRKINAFLPFALSTTPSGRVALGATSAPQVSSTWTAAFVVQLQRRVLKRPNKIQTCVLELPKYISSLASQGLISPSARSAPRPQPSPHAPRLGSWRSRMGYIWFSLLVSPPLISHFPSIWRQ